MERVLQRYLVRRSTKDVFPYNAIMATRKDLEEVYAENAQAALNQNGMPDPRKISLDEIEAMPVKDLILFAKVRMGLELDASKKKAELQDQVKLAIFQPPAEGAVPEAFTPSPPELDRPRARVV